MLLQLSRFRVEAGRSATPEHGAAVRWYGSGSARSGPDDGECDDGGYTAKVEAAVLTAEELREERHAQPLLRELDVPAWQEVAVMRPRWRAMLKSIKIRTVR